MSGAHPPFFANAEVIEINPADIHVPERIGFFHADKAAALGRLMAVDGQRTPINVAPLKKGKKPWQLVTGLHRLRGAEMEGLSVWALEVNGSPEQLAELEASENMHRRDFAPLERAKFTAALMLAAKERLAREHGNLSQHQIAIKARWDSVRLDGKRPEGALRDETDDTCATVAHVYNPQNSADFDDGTDEHKASFGWEELVLEALGFSRRSMHRDLVLYRMLIEPFPEYVEALAQHPVVGANAKQLKELAAIEEEKTRRKAIEALLADPEIGADDARIAAGLGQPKTPNPPKKEKYFAQIDGGWSRLGRPQRREYLPKFVHKLTPGEREYLRELLDEDAGDA